MDAVEREGILYEVHGTVAVITFNKPNSLNSQTMPWWDALMGFVRQANSDDAVGAIVVTGVGRAFSSGADMNETFLPVVRGERTHAHAADAARGPQRRAYCTVQPRHKHFHVLVAP